MSWLSFANDIGMSVGGDSMKFLHRVLTSALGESQAREILDRLTRAERKSAFQLPPNADPRTLAMLMLHERPQTIALLLAHIPHETCANLLAFLPEELAADALYRFSTLDVVAPAAVTELRDMLDELMSNTATGGRRVGNLGGAKQTADILNHLQTGMSDMVLSAIDARDAQTAEKIRENLFTFVDLGKLPDRSLQILLREVPSDRLAPALRLVDEGAAGTVLPEPLGAASRSPQGGTAQRAADAPLRRAGRAKRSGGSRPQAGRRRPDRDQRHRGNDLMVYPLIQLGSLPTSSNTGPGSAALPNADSWSDAMAEASPENETSYETSYDTNNSTSYNSGYDSEQQHELQFGQPGFTRRTAAARSPRRGADAETTPTARRRPSATARTPPAMT